MYISRSFVEIKKYVGVQLQGRMIRFTPSTDHTIPVLGTLRVLLAIRSVADSTEGYRPICCFFLCLVTYISAMVAPIGVKFCMMVHIGPG